MTQSSMPMRAWIAGLIFCIWTPALQAQEPALVVNGKPIVTSPPPTRIGNDLFLPIVPIARALGADVTIGRDQSVSVRRADGAAVTYDSRTGEIRAGNVMIGQVKDYRLIRIVPDISGLLFPLSALVPMFDISVRRDDENKLLYLDSAPSGGKPQNSSPGFSLADLGYAYGLTTNGNVFGQTFNTRAQALAGATTLTGFLQLTRVPNGPAVYLNQATVRADFSPTRSLILGDQGVYSGVDVLTNSMRGVGYEHKLRGFTASLYAGRAIGSLMSSFGSSIPHYDTTLTGASFRRATAKSMFSVGFNAFRNQQRRGVTAGIAYSLRSARNQANVQLAAGQFSGLSLHTVPLIPEALNPAGGSGAPVATVVSGSVAPAAGAVTARFEIPTPSSFLPVRGPAYGVTVSDAFTPIPQISISGQWDYYSRNFLTARDDSRYNGASGGTVSISVRPFRALTLNASAGDRRFLLGDSRRTRNYSVGANLLLPGRRSPQLGFIRTIQTDASAGIGRFQLTQYSVTLPNWNRYSFYGYYSVTSLGKEKTANLNAVTGVDLNRHGRLDFHFQSQAGSHHRYGGDWYRKFGERDGYFRVGVDALSMKHGRAGVLPVVGVRLPLPKRQVVEVSYLRDISTQMLQVQFGGKIVTPLAITRDSRGMARMAARTNLAGLVYIDVNYSGSFDAGDHPIADVRVWRDNEAMVLTDARGYYRFDGVEPGAHTIRAELAGVPAGYIFAGQGTQTLAAAPNRENRADFRVIKTGQVEGKVTYLDYVTDPEQPKESPFPDAHIVATGNRDTYSEANGTFLLGDLAPGRYELRIDPETIPKGYVSQPPSFSVEVTPSAITRDVRFRLVIPPKPVIEIRAPDQKIESR